MPNFRESLAGGSGAAGGGGGAGGGGIVGADIDGVRGDNGAGVGAGGGVTPLLFSSLTTTKTLNSQFDLTTECLNKALKR